ncbi:MAG TPA: NAD(P)H-dependent oxidoreductase subunit E [Candidatus Enteromonas pullicola]|uniref:NAD(P)H-dependent oxidoreductase subunit E n=1 Tax=Candidatus Alloenteromonas pullicola TaxID=2840784 RepID=A0A9D1LNC7_9FIRM|nr:NAD(P)H-dependent oxidoreductase subunit E [Candidatus Enteromonas pullicola]
MPIRHEVIEGVEQICNSYKDEPSPLMMILSAIQKKYGYIPLEVQEIVSRKTGIPVAEIYGVVTFYSFFSLKPKGKYVLGICLGTACYVKNSQAIVDKFSALLGIAPGETTDDGLFTIEAVRCIGACALAPAMTINGKVYPKVTPDQVGMIIDEYRKKEEAN